jgi:hypothetical protein
VRTPVRCVLVSLALLGSTGCLIWPFPTGSILAGRGRVRQEDQTALVIGRTTREEVLLRLGEPDEVLHGGRVFIYRWTQDAGFFAMGGGGSAVAIPFPSHRMLRLAFDSEARLARLDFVHQDELSPEDREAAKAEQPGD